MLDVGQQQRPCVVPMPEEALGSQTKKAMAYAAALHTGMTMRQAWLCASISRPNPAPIEQPAHLGAAGQLLQQGVLRCHHHVRRAKQRVGAGGVHLHLSICKAAQAQLINTMSGKQRVGAGGVTPLPQHLRLEQGSASAADQHRTSRQTASHDAWRTPPAQHLQSRQQIRMSNRITRANVGSSAPTVSYSSGRPTCPKHAPAGPPASPVKQPQAC